MDIGTRFINITYNVHVSIPVNCNLRDMIILPLNKDGFPTTVFKEIKPSKTVELCQM